MYSPLTLEKLESNRYLGLVDVNSDRVRRASTGFIKKCAVPKELYEDCFQETWVALLSSADVFAHLRRWLDAEYSWRGPRMCHLEDLYEKAAGSAQNNIHTQESAGTPEADDGYNPSADLQEWTTKGAAQLNRDHKKPPPFNPGLFGPIPLPGPLHIVIAKLDKACPRCGATQSPRLKLYISNKEPYAGECVCGFWF